MDADGEEDRPAILRAAYAGDVHALRRAIADGADLNVEGEVGEHGDGPYTALHYCELLAAIFIPKPEADKGRRRSKRRRRRCRLQGLPAEVIHHIVSILWDCGGHCEGPLFSYLGAYYAA